MNCWKSFNINRDHGSIRLIILSLFSMITYIIVYNFAITTFFDHMNRVVFNPIMILVCVIFTIPIHKLAHCLPLWLSGKRAYLTINHSIMLPVLNCHFKHPISKRLCLLVMATPALIGTVLSFGLTWFFPSDMDYFGTVGALNFGLSAADFIYIINLLKAPHNSFVEDDQDGCRILIKQTY